ncbi:hypothetical protein [Marinomonas shanghaiensis]|uniref:hypothetical protein n=1 Tax=Marinomonas shanghaiensis TaxID=2202418 RepID=UPI003A95C104|tara:strand:+ start:4708 stop:4902 length:195 start_codon:yes stop_codon:yes gene_type:complete
MSKNKSNEDQQVKVRAPSDQSGSSLKSGVGASPELDKLLSGSEDVYLVLESYGSEPIKIDKGGK